MKIETTKVEKILISEIDRLDPVSVVLEDIGPGQGKIIIECYGQSWASSWGGMGKDRTIAQFFCSSSEDYLAGNLSNIESSITDEDEIKNTFKRQIVKDLREREINIYEARTMFERVEMMELSDVMTGCRNSLDDRELLIKVFGDDWWQSLPTKTNPDYAYLCRIIRAVKEALKFNLQQVA